MAVIEYFPSTGVAQLTTPVLLTLMPVGAPVKL